MEFDLSKAIEILSRTPSTLDAMLRGLSPEWTATSPGSEPWEPFDVVGHLINADETDWIPRAEVILRQGDDLAFPPFDRFAHYELSKGKTLAELLADLHAIRGKCLDTLRGWELTEEQLSLEGVHPEFGRVSLRQLLSTWVVHDLTHIRQTSIALARKYSDAVGPWRAYLSILS